MNRLITNSRQINAVAIALVLVTTVAISSSAHARQFRNVKPIATPTAQEKLPPGAKPVRTIVPLSRKQVEPAVKRVIKSWNSGNLDEHLGDAFYDRTRLLDVVDTVVPRNAKLRLQSVQGVQTLQQYTEPDPQRANSNRLVNRVSVTARTQIEFEAPGGGLSTAHRD